MLNKIILIGRLTRDPELKYIPSGVAVCTFTLAIDRKFNRNETDFIDIVVWRGLAENCANYLHKGRLTAVEGRLQIRSYETQEGQKRKVAEVIADDVRFLRATLQLGMSEKLKAVPDKNSMEIAAIRDTIVSLLSSKNSDDIMTADGKENLREEIRVIVNERIPKNRVAEVFIVDFVIQF